MWTDFFYANLILTNILLSDWMSPAIEAKHLIGQTDYLVTLNVTDLKTETYMYVYTHTLFILKKDYIDHLTLRKPA